METSASASQKVSNDSTVVAVDGDDSSLTSGQIFNADKARMDVMEYIQSPSSEAYDMVFRQKAPENPQLNENRLITTGKDRPVCFYSRPSEIYRTTDFIEQQYDQQCSAKAV